MALLKGRGAKYQYVEFTQTVSFDVYEDEEVSSAERLYLWSRWYWDYPKPDMDGGYKRITYDESKMCPRCGVMQVQKSPFRVKGEPTWGSRQVLRLHWVYDELFVKPEVFEKLSKAGITGIESAPLIHHEKNAELKTIRQLKMAHVLDKGLVIKPSQAVLKCAKCGETKYSISKRGMTAFDGKIFTDAPDFARSFEYFGDGAAADRLICVSHKVYEIFQKEKWKDVVFEPLELT